ncbi:hypothetical protein AKJ66_01425 [candidate division MSBL1 archaeon SCGC-AAA259E22]|uniref:EamA domain-containing protein n=1 Tax=candidate division MSBL1 archaeon SCGC-AAA259E22 TaxID=1698265 RepID=A0A133UHM4_9EURY|nr:hypothetical protein AKJ66_01425 [candidate division MSBL1 archaeon SCGC-AAA259E22]
MAFLYSLMSVVSYSNILAAILATMGGFFFALRAILVKKATVSGDPLEAVLVSYFVNFLTFLPLTLLLYGFSPGFTIKSIIAFIGAGLFGSFLGRTFSFLGIERVGASRTIPISNGYILLGSVFGILLLAEPITIGHFWGIILLVAGVFIVSYEIQSTSSDSLGKWKISIGLIFPLGALLFFSLDSVVAKVGLLEKTPAIPGLTLKFATASLMMSLFFLFRNRSLEAPFKAEDRKTYLWAGLVGSLAMGFYYLALGLARVVVVLPFIGLTPVFVLVLTYFYLQKLERITTLITIGTILVVSGIVLTSIFM